MSNSHVLGDRGEALAARRLLAQGYKILARNYVGGGAEIDIIARKDGVTYFTEVKSRSRQGYANPADNVTARKRQQIARAAAQWFQEQGRETESALLIAEVYPERGEVSFFEDFLC